MVGPSVNHNRPLAPPDTSMSTLDGPQRVGGVMQGAGAAVHRARRVQPVHHFARAWCGGRHIVARLAGLRCSPLDSREVPHSPRARQFAEHLLPTRG